MKQVSLLIFLFIAFIACKTDNASSIETEAQKFLDDYTAEYLKLATASAEAEWKANTYIMEGDTLTDQLVEKANQAFSDFTGSEDVITSARKLLESKDALNSTIARQLDAILYQAANNPATVSDLVSERIKAENQQNKALFGYEFTVNGKAISTSDMDNALVEETNEAKRKAVWEASKNVGVGLKDGLENLVELRNKTVQALGYDDYYSYQVSDYGMSREELTSMMHQMVKDVWPLYRELHTWTRYELAKKYNSEVPDMLPAHWLPNRWGQDWSALVNVEGLDLDGALKDKSPEWVVQQGEEFYVSLGFDKLPKSFYEKSSMYPLPEGTKHKKNNHASAWHMDLQNDLRCLMSIVPTAEYYETVHHELGHIYYYQAYSTPEVPPLLRGGANRGYHEAIGSLLGLAAMQKPFLVERGLIDDGAETDEMQTLLKEALNYIVFIPWSGGVMTHFEDALYADNLSKDQYNAKWWELKNKYQGITTATERGEEYCDAASKTHINNDAAQYYDYGISYILLFQFHDHIAKQILKQDPRATNYYGSKEVGEFLKSVLSVGANCDWRTNLKESVGSEMSAKPMLEYFAPLKEYLSEINKGRKHSLPESI
jgi:peptidyl-dipeptidase A